MKRLWRLLRVALIVGLSAAILVIVTAGLLFLLTPGVRQAVLHWAADGALSRNRMRLEVRETDFSVTTGLVVLRGVRLSKTGGRNYPALLEAETVRLHFARGAGIKGTLRLIEVKVEGASLLIQSDEAGETNLPTSSGGGKWSDPLEGVAALLAPNLRFRFEDRRERISVELPQVSLSAREDVSGKSHLVQLNAGQKGVLRLDRQQLALEQCRARATLRPDGVSVEDLEIRPGSSAIKLSGRYVDAPEWGLEAGLQSDLNLADLTSVVFPAQRMRGRVTVESHVRRQAKAWVLDAVLHTQKVEPFWPQETDLRAGATYDPGTGRVRVEKAQLTSLGAVVEAVGNMALVRANSASTAEAQLRGLSSGRLLAALGATAPFHSTISARGKVQWSGWNWKQARAELQAKLEGGQPTAGSLPVNGAVEAIWDKSGLSATVRSLESGGTSLSGTAALRSDGTLTGELQGATPNLGESLREFTSIAEENMQGLGFDQIAGPVKLEARLSGTAKEPVLDVRARSDELRIRQVEGVGLDAEARLQGSHLRVSRFDLTRKESELRASGDLDFTGVEPQTNVAGKLRGAQLSDVADIAGVHASISGVLSADLSATGPLRNPTLTAKISADQFVAYDEPLGRLSGTAHFDGTTLSSDSMELVKAQEGEPGRATLAGRWNVREGTYSVAVESNEIRISRLHFSDGTTIQGVFRLKGQGQGVAANPTFSAEVSGEEVTVQHRKIGAVRLTAHVKDKRADWLVLAPALKAEAKGTVGTEAPYPAEAALELADSPFPISEGRRPDEAVSLELNATAKASGQLANWKDFSVELFLRRLVYRQGPEELRSEGSTHLAYRGGVLAATPSTLESSEGRVTLTGSIALEGTPSSEPLRVRAGLDLTKLQRLSPALKAMNASGTLEADASVSGTIRDPRFSGKITLQGGRLQPPGLPNPVEDISAVLVTRDRDLVLEEATAKLGPGTLRAEASVPIEMARDALFGETGKSSGTARLSLEGEKLGASFVSEAGESRNVTASFRAEAETNRLALDAVRTRLEFRELEYNQSNLHLAQLNPTTLTMENGLVRLDRIEIGNAESRFEMIGTIGVTGSQAVDVQARGSLDARILSPLTGNISFSGPATGELRIGGTLAAFDSSGFVEWTNGRMLCSEPRLALEVKGARLDFSKEEGIRLSRLEGTLNGGTVSGTGTLRANRDGLGEVQIDLKGKNVFFEYPAGFQTLVSADASIKSRGQSFVIGGELRVSEGGYREDIRLQSALVKSLTSRQVAVPLARQNPLLAKVVYDLAIRTTNPLIFRNNLLDLTADANLRLIGSYYHPVLTGRLKADEGARLYAQGRIFNFNRGEVNFLNEARTEPMLDVSAQTKVSSYTISLRISGTPDDLDTTWSSSPQLSEEDIYSVLMTGKPLDKSSQTEAAQTQAVALLSDEMGSRVSQGLGRFLGGNTRVRIEPGLIAAETNPGARLTIGQDFTPTFRATYSMNLTDSNDQIWIVEYDLRRRFNARGVKQSDNTYRGEFRHDYRFGGGPGTGDPPPAAASAKRKLGEVKIEGTLVFPEAQLLKETKLKPGGRYDFFKGQKAMERLSKFYHGRNYLEARARQAATQRENLVDISIDVQAGMPVEFRFQGYDLSRSLRKEVKKEWQDGLFDEQRKAESVTIIQNHLLERGWLESKVECVLSAGDAGKLVTLEVTPGRRFSRIEIVFRGLDVVKSSELMAALSAGGMVPRLRSNGAQVAAYLADYLRKQGYLWAVVNKPAVELPEEGTDARLVIPVKEGPRARLAAVHFSGNNALSDAELRAGLKVEEGMVVGSSLDSKLRQALQDKYWHKGYRDVVITPAVNRLGDGGTVDLSFAMEENRQTVVAGIRVEGNVETSQKYILDLLRMGDGTYYDYVKANEARRRLYDSQAFLQADLIPQPLTETAEKQEDGRRPVNVVVRVREQKPFRILYGPTYDSERGPGVIVDFENHNTLGAARTFGFRFRYDGQETEQRAYLAQPFLKTRRVTTNLSAYRETQQVSVYDVTKLGVTLQEDIKIRKKFTLSFGYRWEQADVHSNDPTVPYSATYSDSPLFASLTRDTRDDVLDAYRGSFQSMAIDYGPKFFPGNLPYYRFFPQYFIYVPLMKPPQLAEAGRRPMPKLVFASAIRVGLSAPIGGTLIPTERFFAGGGTSIRGFEQNAVGPTLSNGEPAGGNAMLVGNEELRFPLWKWVSAAAFLDFGNVYPTISDFTLKGLRSGAGAGLRFRAGFLLLRFDYGFNLGPRPGEKSGTWFFSIGQMF